MQRNPPDSMNGDPTPGSEPRPATEQDAQGTVAADPLPTSGQDAPVQLDPPPEPGVEAGTAPQPEEELRTRLSQLEAEHEQLRSQYMRIAADFDNFRKRQSRDHEDLRIQIKCTTLSEILPVVDNFDRARQQLDPQSEEAQTLHRSYQGLYKQLVDIFKQLGVSPMRVEGEPFDPSLHEAVMREPSHEHPEDVVIEELQRGYHINGRVLRHALVKVSMGPGPTEGGESGQSESSGEPGGS